MFIGILLICAITGYLAGSLNFAILVSRWAKGIDIRTVGNKNPGTANVGREVGRGWAALVFAGDLAKVLVPLILFDSFLLTGESLFETGGLFLTGIMGVTGHCWPLYHRFRGGGGLATIIGVFSFFIPVELFAALLVSFLIVVIFFRRRKYPFGQLVPMLFIPLAPLFTTLVALFLEVNREEFPRFGGYQWYLVAGVWALSVYILFINIRIVLTRFKEEGSP